MTNKIFIPLIAGLIVIVAGVFFLSFYFGVFGADNSGDFDDEKVYSNSVLGFEIKYPDKWRTEECTYEQFGIVGFGDSSQPLLICNSDAPPLSYVNVQVGGPSSQYDLLIKNTEDNLDNVTKSEVQLNGRPAIKLYGEARPTEGPGLPAGTRMTFIFAKDADKIFIISHWNLENKDYLKEYEDMVATFKFIEAQP